MIVPEISASKVAGFIGLHKYQNTHEIFYELLSKDPETKARIAEIEKKYNRKSFNRVLNEVMKEGAVMDCISSGIAAAQKTEDVTNVLAEVEEQANLILSLRRDSYSPEVRSLLAAEIRGSVSKRRGIANENKILDKYEIDREVKVTERNTKTCRKDFGTFRLVGRTDGFVASENRIVDSKDRTRWWASVPLYDEIQLRVYMNLTGATESELVERFPDGRERHTKYTNDADKWTALETAMIRATEKMNLAAEDDAELERVVFANTVCVM